ncbi:MAG: chorismate-binding protein [Nonlabens sp.]
MRNCKHFTIDDLDLFKRQVMEYYKCEEYFTLLESNSKHNSNTSSSALIAIGAIAVLETDCQNAFKKLQHFKELHKDWIFGLLGYDLKNEVEQLKSKNPDIMEFPDLIFYIPELVMEFKDNNLLIHFKEDKTPDFESLLNKIKGFATDRILYSRNDRPQSHLVATDTREEYLDKVDMVRQHIQQGDIYEANFCTQFYATDVDFDLFRGFRDLNQNSQPPFAALARLKNYGMVSASPERYLKKTGLTVISQPIKGTARRSDNLREDDDLKSGLINDQKERSENIMIVDLVRNDLSRTAQKGTVEVTELFKLYTFKQVHQMISTIESKVSPAVTLSEILATTFPMGSMTGAPKVEAMKIIENLESFKRGAYSGALGYCKPDGDFDFSVLIRTILYNTESKNLSFSVGSAITIAAVPEREYDECLVKAAALLEVLEKQGIKRSHHAS